jgi:phage recombination protein Bet
MKKENQLQKIEQSFELVTKEQVKQHICPQATEQEIAYFLEICKLHKLNPFKREIYLVKYQGSPASVLTGYEVYLKRAERTGNYDGFKVWTEGEGEKMVAKIEVRRKDWAEPLCHEVEYREYVGKKKDGTITRFWREKPKTMLKKVVISQGFRLAFPDEIGGMPYTSAEVNSIDAEVVSDNPKAGVKPPKRLDESGTGREFESLPYELDEAPPVKKLSRYEELLLNFKKAKAFLGATKYYNILDSYNFKHANEIKDCNFGDAVLTEMRSIYNGGKK